MNPLKSVVYMADDDADDRFFMCQALRTSDPSVTIIEAEDGQDLLALLLTRSQESTALPVSLILLDMNMPRSNGLETLIALKANLTLRYIPTVMISTSAEPGQVVTAYQNGISSYIQKPVTSFDMNGVAQALKVCFLDAAMNSASAG